VLASCVLHEKNRPNGRLEIRAAKAHVWRMDGTIFFSAIFAASILIWLGTLWRKLHIKQTETGSDQGTANLFAISLGVLALAYAISRNIAALSSAPEIIIGAAFAISAFFFIGQLR
jgi:hypothetical protein